MAGSSAREQLGDQIDAIEGAYEYFLAYAAQGLSREVDGSHVTQQFKDHLNRMVQAVRELGPALGALLEAERLPDRDQLRAFRTVLEADATAALSVLQLVQAKSFATSQIVDNLNASVHVRTLLTDLFLLDEALGLGVDGRKKAQPASSAPKA
jgi:hypothetical protein